MADEPRDDDQAAVELDADERARRQHELEELAVQVLEDPGSSAFPALAEAYRRAGLVDEARRVVERGLEAAPERMAGRVALGLVLIEQGEIDAARLELMRVFDDVSPRAREVESVPLKTPRGTGGHQSRSQPHIRVSRRMVRSAARSPGRSLLP